MGKLVLKICGGTWDNASRDKRELSVYRELGERVLVLAKGEEGDAGRMIDIDGFPVLCCSTRPLGERFPASLNRAASLFTWAHAARRLAPDVISGHDILGLTIGWMSGAFRRKKPKLIYDSHEFELGRVADRGSLRLLCVKYLERYLMKKSCFSIVVNDSIADEDQRIHRLRQRPVVVRSTPGRWEVREEVCRETRARILERFPGEVRQLMMFHGCLGRGNGIEGLLPLLARHAGLGLVLLGKQTDGELVDELVRSAEQLGVSERLLFLPAVDLEELWKYVGAADVEMMLIEPIVKSYYYALPNKLFEAIQAETPVIASDLPEMKRIVEQYRVGLCCAPGDVESSDACLEKLLTDKAFYQQCKNNLRAAKETLCWEKEKQVLLDAYARYVDS